MPDINNETYQTTEAMDATFNPLFQYNGRTTNINIDNALAAILNKFDDDYTIGMVEQSLNYKFRPYDQPMPNMVYGQEQRFIELLEGFTANQPEIAQKRYETYISIINILCEKHNLSFNNADDVDLYSAAFYLYKFLVSEFTNNIITFYTNFLIRERSSLYNSLNLKEFKKNDVGMAYSNKLFASEKLSLIHGNIGYVIENMASIDIDLYSILELIYYPDKEIPRYIFSLVTDNGNFFKSFYEPYAVDLVTGPELQTLIKLNLQNCAAQLVDIDE